MYVCVCVCESEFRKRERREREREREERAGARGKREEEREREMALSLWTLLQAALLFTNGFAILNEERFLKKYNITLSSGQSEFYGGPAQSSSLKAQLAGFLHACSYLRVPLIFLNIVVILVKTLFG